MSPLRAQDVFTPSDFPLLTYVERGDLRLETRLRDAIDTPGELISVSGPSKSGKTVLVERVVGEDDLIPVSGAGVASPDDLWNRVLDWMGAPQSTTTTSSTTQSKEASTEASLGAKVPFLGSVSAKAAGSRGRSSGETESTDQGRRGLTQVVDEIAGSSFVLLIDDFHYIDRSVQSEIARQLKAATEAGVKICVASVPHRSDDVVRSNPELRGRVHAINMNYWKEGDLEKIAELGFEAMKLGVHARVVSLLSKEASGSPQLMQAICLQTCRYRNHRKATDRFIPATLTDDDVALVLSDTSSRTDYSSLVRRMRQGPKVRGTERKEHQLVNSTSSDVYGAVLLALAADPPSLSFDYSTLLSRVENCCIDDPPRPQSIMQACKQIGEIAMTMYPEQRVVEWDADESLLDVIDPYLLFFLRHGAS